MSSGGYLGTAAHVTGTRAGAIEEYVNLGINMRRGGRACSTPAAIKASPSTPRRTNPWRSRSGWARRTPLANGRRKPVTNCPKTCGDYQYRVEPVRRAVRRTRLRSCAWRGTGARDPGGHHAICVHDASRRVRFLGRRDLLRTKSVEKVPGAVPGFAGSTEPKPPGPTSITAAESPATKPADKPRSSRSADSRGKRVRRVRRS